MPKTAFATVICRQQNKTLAFGSKSKFYGMTEESTIKLKMKKILSLAVAGAMMLSTMVVSVGAVDTTPEETDTASYEGFYAQNPLGGDDIYVSAENVAETATVVQDLVEAGVIKDPNEEGIMPLYGGEIVADGVSTWDYSFALSGKEGISSTKANLIKVHARTAKETAEKQYSDATMIDSCRHFVWNFLGTKDSSVGAWYMRVECNNYEWAHLCHAALANHYNYRKKKWIEQGATDWATKAFVDTVSYFQETKKALIQAIKDGPDYAQFAKTVDEDSAMDFWNNQKGREWAQKSGYQNTTAGALKAYIAAYGDGITGELIDSTTYIKKGSTKYRTLFANTNWWSH